MQTPGDAGETVASPTVAKRHGNRDHLRPAPQGHAIELAHELREKIVGIQFLDEHLSNMQLLGMVTIILAVGILTLPGGMLTDRKTLEEPKTQ